MDFSQFLLYLLYILGAILLVVLIVLNIKLIITMNKIDDVVEDINKKTKSLDGVFSIIDITTDKLAFLSDKLVDALSIVIKRIFTKKNRKEETENE